MATIERALKAPRSLSAEDISSLLASNDGSLWRDVFAAAREVKRMCGKTVVLPRMLIECSNICAKDCLYCGIRKGNDKARRYRLSESVVASCIRDGVARGFNAVAFQAGEIEGEENTAYYERLLSLCEGLEVTLSLGEQTEEVYRRWKEAGAMRYLIRIETSNRELFAKIHPAECSFERRLSCIRALKKLGYITGTGVMIGLPGQTIDDLAKDIVFYGDENVDMVGMGPYIPHCDTPMGMGGAVPSSFSTLEMTYRMIALTRLYLWNINIVAATALDALDPVNGRRRGLESGANFIMPNITPDS